MKKFYYLFPSSFEVFEKVDDLRFILVVIVDTTSFLLSALEPPTVLLPLTKSGLPLIAVRDI